MSNIQSSYYGIQIPLNRYIENKIRMLQREFIVKLEDSEIEYMRSLKTEYQVDSYAHKLIMDKL